MILTCDGEFFTRHRTLLGSPGVVVVLGWAVPSIEEIYSDAVKVSVKRE